MPDIDKNKLFEAVEGSTGGKIDKNKINKAINSGDISQLLGALPESDRQKINNAISDKNALKKALGSAEAKQILNAFLKGGKKNG
ncbi:MAG: hypothetical protein II802_02475 [Clostridia bacterium]|nr:hypothetical protein [Clostridia bacterium]